MKLFNSRDLHHLMELNSFGSPLVARLLMKVMSIRKVNRLYSGFSQKEGLDFIDAFMEELDMRLECSEAELQRIPKTGPFITISNQPFGGMDVLLLIKLISHQRSDFKVFANQLLQRVDSLREFVYPANPFITRMDSQSNLKALKMAFTHLQEGHALGLFPAAEVSSFNDENYIISDSEWNTAVLRLIKKSKVPVVPVYFKGTNSRLFHLLGKIHPILRTAKLPSELTNKKNRSFQVRVGNPISLADQHDFGDISQFGRFLRAKTYALGSSLEVKRFFIRGLPRLKKVQPIANAQPFNRVAAEIERVKQDYLLFSSKNYSVICAPSIEFPSVILEVGRLREITFREVGEGTNRSTDIDEYDLYYNQLIIWDDEAKQIVGAYRVGLGNNIVSQYGIKGFYLNSLFKLNKKLIPVLKESLELGRSFIVSEYQRKPLSLFLLWKGILYFLIKHPEYRYLIGPVSISNEFSEFSRGLIVDFIRTHFFNNEIAKYIQARKEFVVEADERIDKEIILEKASNDLNKFDKLIQDIEPNFRLPVLLKKYLSLNARIAGFNLDPKFNDALDGLLILDLYDVPRNIIESLGKEVNDSTILERFTISENPN